MINDNFLVGLAKLLAGESYTIPSYLAFGSVVFTPTSTDTYLSGEFDRNITTNTRVNSVARFTATRGFAEANNEYINGIALVNSSTLYSSNNIQADDIVPSLLHTSDFDVDIEYWVTITRE